MANRPIKRVLVLSGGGARGAYQVGVCKYLYSEGWEPDLILGNSIGATNGAILAAPNYQAVEDPEVRGGFANVAEFLEHVWRTSEGASGSQGQARNRKRRMWNRDLYVPPRPLLLGILDLLQGREEDTAGIVDDLMNAIPPEERDVLDREIDELSQDLDRPWESEDERRKRLFESLLSITALLVKFIMSRRALIRRPGWRKVVSTYVDMHQLNGKEAPYFGIAATDVQTGAPQVFWNHKPPKHPGIQGVETRLTAPHVLSSSSIFAIYRSTQAGANASSQDRFRWDGALVDNVPIGPALKLIPDIDHIVVVIMTRWAEDPEGPGFPLPSGKPWPTVGDALSLFLDWMMLAPLRSELDRLTQDKRDRYVTVVWPQDLKEAGSDIDFLISPVSMIDYIPERNEKLIAAGEHDAKAQIDLKKLFP